MTPPSADILAEHGLSSPLRPSDRNILLAEGIPLSALTWTPCGHWCAPVARDRVVFLGGRKFEFARYLRDSAEARNAFVLPLFDAYGEPADVLAWRPGAPPAVWLGRVAMAGAEQVWWPRPACDAEIVAHETVLSWLVAGRHGIVILDHLGAADQLAGTTLRAGSAEHARRLRVALTRPAPKVVVRDLVYRVHEVEGCAA